MNKLTTAVALAIALPGVAHAQAAPAEKPKMECCQKMEDECGCCNKAAARPADKGTASSSNPHAGHDMKLRAPAGGHPMN